MNGQSRVRAVFVHDHKFICDGDGIYSPGQFSDRVLGRYLSSVEELNVVGRGQTGVRTDCSRVSLAGVRFFLIPARSFFFVFTWGLCRSIKCLGSAIRASNFGILRLPSFLGTVAGFWMMLRGVPYVVELVAHPREAILASEKGGIFGRVIAFLLTSLTRVVLGRASGVVYVTRVALQKEFPFNGITAAISNVDLDDPPYQKRSTKRSDERFRMGIIGSFAGPYKGIDTAIRALSLIRSQGLDVELRILGKGDPSSYIALASSLGVAQFVFFDGLLEGGRPVQNWLDNLDVYLQPSRTEGLPRALIEAMSRSLACVGSNVGGIPELLEQRWIVQANDSESFAARVIELLHNSELRVRVGARNMQEAAGFGRSELARRRAQFFQEVLSSRYDKSEGAA